MKKTNNKIRGPWLEILLVCAIIVLGSSIFYFTMIDKEISVNNSSASTIEQQLQLTTSERPSSIEDVAIVTISGEHPNYPFELNFPKSKYDAINEEILAYITKMKNTYISAARIAHNVDGASNSTFNITTQIYQHENRYYSFVLTATEQIANQDAVTTIQTFLVDHSSGKMMTIADLFNNDEKSLQTFASHVQSQLTNDKAIASNWQSFKHFALYDDQLTIYLTDEHATPAVITPVVMSLSYLNPLLNESFQTEMVEANKPTESAAATNKKRIALTFDDGPHAQVTLQILATLEKYNAKATFYVLGTRVEQSPEILKQAFDAGHEIGNHTWSHPKLTKMTAAQIKSEFETTENIIQQVIGQPAATFRPPYGMTNDFVQEVVPLPTVRWTIDTEDWRHRNANALLPAIKNNLHNDAIVLMHDIHQSTADGLESVLAYLQAEGYTFVTVSEILQQNES